MARSQLAAEPEHGDGEDLVTPLALLPLPQGPQPDGTGLQERAVRTAVAQEQPQACDG